MKSLISMAVMATLALPAASQVAPGEGIEFLGIINSGSPGLAMVDAAGSGARTFVTGLPSTDQFFNAGVIDPVTGDIWAAGFGATQWSIYRMSLTGANAGSFTQVADVSGLPMGPGLHDAGISGMDVDRDGNLFICERTNIWRIDRQTNAVTTWNTGFVGYVNALTIDRETNTMWTLDVINGLAPTFGEIRTYDLDAGPGGGTQFVDMFANPNIPPAGSSICYDGIGTLYVGTFNALFSIDAVTGAFSPMPMAGVVNKFNSLNFDERTGLLHTGGGTQKFSIYSVMDPASLLGTVINSDLECFPGSNPSDFFCQQAASTAAVDVNDYLHTTQLFPRTASASAGFTLEASANGMPGDFAAIAVGEINGLALASPIVLGGYGLCGLGGNFVYSSVVPGGVVPSGITSLGIGTATYDFATGVFSYGGIETLTLNP